MTTRIDTLVLKSKKNLLLTFICCEFISDFHFMWLVQKKVLSILAEEHALACNQIFLLGAERRECFN
jgi:hypothetical protein